MSIKLFLYTVFTQYLFLITVLAGVAINYCSPKFCNNSKQHTLCRFRSPGQASECTDYERTITNKEQKAALLDKINSRRSKIASGDVRSFPPAENMMRLIWNEDLAESAQRWADQCVAENALGYEDICRDLDGTPVGQSVASVYGEAPGLSPLSLVDVWYMELLNVNSSVLPHYRPSSERGLSHYDYFAQLVWARSSEVGCGSVKFKERLRSSKSRKNRTVYRLVCNFAPSGNVLNEPVYTEGPICSRCPNGANCDSTYSSLCSATKTDQLEAKINEPVKMEEMPVFSVESSLQDDINLPQSEFESNVTDDNTSVIDYFSEIYDFTRQSVTMPTVKSSYPCKDSLEVDDFVELLKKKLTTDPLFKELLSTKQSIQNGNIDVSFTDPSVAAFVSKLYSKKEETTTTKLPEQEYVNSTLLVDLVEAVIFRSGDKTFSTEEPKDFSQSLFDVSPVKIQAELAEVKLNNDFTGHYFFPEDSPEESVQETTDSYYDTSNIPASDVIFELESIKREKVTQDFLEEIIESDAGADESKETRKKRTSGREDFPNEYNFRKDYEDREIKLAPYDYTDDNIIVKYSELLQKLASDFKQLKLNDRFHCSCSQNDTGNTKIPKSLRLILTSIMLWSYMFWKQ